MKVIILGTGDIALEVLKKLQEDARINVLGIICDESVRNEANEQYQKQVVSAGEIYWRSGRKILQMPISYLPANIGRPLQRCMWIDIYF